MDCPKDLKYTKEHEWVRVEGATAVVGITEFAQEELGEIVFVELPQVGRQITQGESFCVAESTKAASDIYAPIGGKVREINETLSDSPNLVNSSPYGEGWMVKLEGIDPAQTAALMSAEQYEEFVKSSH